MVKRSDDVVIPGRFVPACNHWYWSGATLVTLTVKVTLSPRPAMSLTGFLVIWGKSFVAAQATSQCNSDSAPAESRTSRGRVRKKDERDRIKAFRPTMPEERPSIPRASRAN